MSFRNQCRKIHEKNHPNAKIILKEIPSESITIVEEENPYEITTVPSENSQELSFEDERFEIIEEKPKRKTAREKKLKTDVQTSNKDTETSLVVYDTNDNTEMLMEHEENSKHDESKKAIRKSFTVAQKLDIVAYAEENSNRQAARHYDINESTVRCFRRQKAQLITMKPEKSTNRHGTVYWPDLEEALKTWVKSQKDKPRIHQIQKEACVIAKSLGYQNFSGSTSYIFKFMQRNGINSSSPRPRKSLRAENSEENEPMD